MNRYDLDGYDANMIGVNDMNVERIRELTGYLVSMAALHDAEMAKQFADELEELLQPIGWHDVDEFYPDNEDVGQ